VGDDVVMGGDVVAGDDVVMGGDSVVGDDVVVAGRLVGKAARLPAVP
jgi:hypothetical protein